MLGSTVSTVSLLALATLATTTNAHPQPHLNANGVFAKRWGGCGSYGGIGGYGSYGFPFVSSFTNDFDRCSSCADFNENTLYTNNKCASCASDNVHCCNNANVIA
ncbi:hypothetical protein GGF42_008805 [Coemansia sp. RSA 2424]|nr:hypothetical protein GGF42_008805 [Coemansia sp. RSA 2424]